MIKDISQIINNLLSFYDFKNKTIVSVGAGGGQFIWYAKVAKHVIAIDNNKAALDRLKENISINGLTDKFTLIHSNFSQTNVKGDVVLFEFCLHEMDNPQRMLQLAKKVANQVVIADHGVNSQWAFIADETTKAENSWAQVLKNRTQKLVTHKAEQYFQNYNQLYEKVKVQGQNSIDRISEFKECSDIVIPMEYTFALI